MILLHLILGRVGSGKTTHVHKLIEDYIKDGLSDIVLIVPEQFSFATEKAMLNRLDSSDANKVEVLSFTRLADSVFREYGGKNKRQISAVGRVILMSLALESVKDKLELYGNHADRPALINEMLGISSEFKQCAVSHDKLFEATQNIADCLLRKKMKDISLILYAYNALAQQSNIDDGDTLDDLYASLGENKFFEKKIVVIDGFKGFTQQELKIIERILSQTMVTYITLCMDNLYPLSEDAGVFTHVKRTAIKLIEMSKKLNIKLAKPLYLSGESKFCNFPPKFKRYESEALGALEAELFSAQAGIYEKHTDDITICSAADIPAECAYVAAQIKKLMREKSIRCREIAVIARNSEKYEAPLKSALKKCGIPVFEDKREPITVQPLISCVCSAVDIAAHGFSSDAIFSYLKSGLGVLSVEEAAELENYCIMWKIDWDRWLSVWDKNPEGYGAALNAREAQALEGLNRLRERVISPLLTLKNKLADANGVLAAKAVYEFLIQTSAPEKLRDLAIRFEDSGENALALEQERLWDLLMDILDEIAVTLGNRKISATRFFELFRLIIKSQTLGNIPQGIDEITFGSADRIRTASTKAVFVIGVNDGLFPLSPISKGILNDYERKEMIKLGITVSEPYEYKVYEERFIAYTSLCCASHKLFVTYPRKDVAGASLAPSELIFRISRRFPNCSMVDTECLDETELIEGVRPAFELMCLKSRESGELYYTLREYFSRRNDYAGKLAALERVKEGNSFHIKDKKLSEKLFGENMYLSASKAEKYYQCPFQYFCKYGIGAKPRNIAEFDPMQKGTTIHFVLEAVLSTYSIEEFSSFDENKRKAIIKDILDKYLEEKLGGADKPKRFTYLYNRLVIELNEVFSRMIAESFVSSFRPVDFELKIDNDGKIMPYEIKLSDGKVLKIKGYVDRVDKMELDGKSYIRIIDYKLSKGFKLSDVFSGINMQMLIYLFSIWQNGGSYYGEIVPSGILYYSANAPVANKNNREVTDEEILKAKLKKSKMKGLILNDSVVITGMDSTGEGVFIPANISKSSVGGNIISLEQLGKLKNKVDNLLKEMALSLKDGIIDAVPISNACDYCDYKSVCGWEKGMALRDVPSFNHKESLAILDEMEAENDGMDG